MSPHGVHDCIHTHTSLTLVSRSWEKKATAKKQKEKPSEASVVSVMFWLLALFKWFWCIGTLFTLLSWVLFPIWVLSWLNGISKWVIVLQTCHFHLSGCKTQEGRKSILFQRCPLLRSPSRTGQWGRGDSWGSTQSTEDYQGWRGSQEGCKGQSFPEACRGWWRGHCCSWS